MSKLVFIQVNNPLDPRDSDKLEREFDNGQSLAQLFPAFLYPQAMSWSVNGRVIESEEMASTFPQDGDYVVAVPIPQGGEGNKAVLRVVALVAIAVVAPYATTAMLGINGAAAIGAAGVGAVTVGVTVAGSMLVNALLPPPKPPKSADQGDSSPTYGIDGAKNTSAEGLVVPVTYGEFRMAGNIIGNYVVNDDDTQILYMLLCAGEGQIASITDIQVNDQPITNYKDYEVETRLGGSAQSQIKWFADTTTPHSVGQEVLDTYKFYTTTGEVDRIRIDFAALTGLFRVSDKGNIKEAHVNLTVEYRKQGTSTWLAFPAQGDVISYNETTEWVEVEDVNEWGQPTGTMVPYTPTGSEVRVGDKWQKSALLSTVVGYVKKTPVYSTSGVFQMSSSKRSVYRKSYISAPLTEGVYEIRYKRNDAPSTDTDKIDNITLTDVNEIVTENIRYKSTALLALKIRLTDQLNGVPKVTFLNGGKLVRVWDFEAKTWKTEQSSNPAWLTLDTLTNKRYGGGASLSRIDLAKWKEWAEFCDEEGLTFHGVFDVQENVWDTANKIARCGHAQVVPMGTRFSVVIEKPESPVMMFNVGNIIEGTFKETWLPMSDRANEVEVSYYDKADNYQQHTVRVYDQAALTAGAPQRVSNVNVMGITDAQRAYDEAMIMLNLNRYILRSVEFGATLEAIACNVGDVILVQHDMPAWGQGGRLESGSTSTVLKLDREVTMEDGKTYQALVHLDTLQRAAGTINSIVGTVVYLNSYSGSTAVKRFVHEGKDHEVISIQQNGSLYGVELASVAGMSVGESYVLYDTNALVTRSVVNTAPVGGFVTVTQVTLTSGVGATPAAFSKWMFGETTKVSKPFRVKAISGSHEYRRDITAIEYNASVYDPAGAVPTPNYSYLDDVRVQPVTILGVSEELVLNGTVYESRVTISYESNQSTYQDAEVFLSRDGGGYRSLGRDRNGMTVRAFQGEVLEFRVVARDRFGRNAAVATSPSFTYTVVGRTTNPGAVTGFGGSFTNSGITLVWNRPSEPDWQYITIRQGGTWAGGTQVFQERTTFATLPFRTVAGSVTYWARHSIPGIEATADGSVTLNVTVPATATFGTPVVSQGTVSLSWNDCRTSQPLRRHTIKVGTTSQSYAAAQTYAVISGSAESHTIAFTSVGTKRIWVVAEDQGGLVGTPAYVDAAVTTIGNEVDTIPPPTPSNLTAEPGFIYNMVRWDAPTYTQGRGNDVTVVYAATRGSGDPAPLFGAAEIIGETSGFEFKDLIGTNITRHYWIKFRSKDGVLSDTPAGGTNGVVATTGHIEGVDLAELTITASKLADGIITADKLADESLDATKFAQGIEPVTVVPGGDPLPTTKSTTAIVWGSDLYRWNGTAYVKNVDAEDIQGQITDAQVAALAAAKLTGQVNTDQIGDATVLASKLYVGDTTNVYPDFDMVDAAYYATTTAAAYSLVATSYTTTGSKRVQIAVSAASEDVYTKWFPVTADTDYLVELLASMESGTGTVTAAIEFGSLSSTGDVTQTRSVTVVNTSTVDLTRKSVTALTTSTERRARFRFTRAAGGTGVATFGGPMVRRRANGSLIVDGAITAQKVAANAIDATKIVAGSIGAQQIAANAITAEKLVLADLGNYVENPNFNDGSVGWVLGTGASIVSDVSNAYQGTWVFRFTGTTANSTRNNLIFPVTPGDQFYGEAVVKAASGTTAGTFTVAVRFVQADKSTLVSAGTIGNFTQADLAYVTRGSSITVPAGAVYAYVYIVCPVTSAGAWYVGRLSLRRKAAGSLIVDGSISANHVGADAITAGKIAAGAVNADQIVAGAILASKMTLTDTSNIFPDFDMVDDAFYSGPFVLGATAYAISGKRRLMIEPDAASQTVTTGWFQVEPSAEYTVEMFGIRDTNAGSTATASAVMDMGSLDGAGVITTTRSVATVPATSSTTLVKITTKLTAASTERRARIRMVRAAGGDARVTFGGIVIRRRANADLIVDGAITADKIAANAIAVGTAAIENGALQNAMIANGVITDAKIVNLNAEKLTAGIINAARIGAGSITADKLVSKTLTVNQLAEGVLSANLAFNGEPGISDIGTSGWYQFSSTAGSGTFTVGTTSITGLGTRYFVINKSAPAAGTAWACRPFSVTPGLTYRIKFRAKAGATTTNGRYIRIAYGDTLPSNGQLSTATMSELTTANSAWSSTVTDYEYTWTAPTGTRWATLAIYNWTAGPDLVYVDNVDIRCDNAVAVIQPPGSIYGDSLVVNSVDAATIKAGTITTDRLIIGSVSANVKSSDDLQILNLSSTATGYTSAARGFGVIAMSGGTLNLNALFGIQIFVNNEDIDSVEVEVDVLRNGSVVYDGVNSLVTVGMNPRVDVNGTSGAYAAAVIPFNFLQTLSGTQTFTYRVSLTFYNGDSTAAVGTGSYIYLAHQAALTEIKV